MPKVVVHHKCGHMASHAAWGKRVAWLATRPCPECAGLGRPNFAPGEPVKSEALGKSSGQAGAYGLPTGGRDTKLPEGVRLPWGFVTEYRFASPRKWRFDYAWPAARIALEIEGGVYVGGHHSRGKGFEADCEKYNQAAFEGWRVFRATPRMLAAVIELHVARLLAVPPAWQPGGAV